MRRIFLALVAASFAAGCATTISGSPETIARLEKARASSPRSAAAQRSLGIAYYKAKRYPDARTALQQATSLDPRDGVAALYLGLTAEEQNDIPGARAAYQTYLDVGQSRGAKSQIRDRMQTLRLKEIQVAAKEALAKESQLANVPGSPNTVAVMPFQFSGADTTLRPIERGFAELVTTDLSRVSRLTVLERERIQALLDEMKLQQNVGAAAGTGVRAGKMLGVGRMVSGSIQQQQNQLQTSALLTDATTATPSPAASASSSIDDLFTMEKTIVFGILQTMNITPTTAERNAIEQRPTRSLAAFISYSRGLEQADQGRFDAASRFFDNAVRLDPSFGSAQQKSQESKAVISGSQVSASTVESSLRGSESAAAGNSGGGLNSNTVGGGASTLAEGLNPSAAGGATGGNGGGGPPPNPDPSSSTQSDNPTTKTGKVTIIIHQPGKP